MIYFFYNHSAPVFLLTVYKKGDQENLVKEEEKILAQIAQELKKTLKAKSRGIR